MGRGGRSARLGEVYATQGLSGASEKVGGRADTGMDRPAKEDEQGLREAVCERRGVGVRCHDSPHDEASRPCLRVFHTASPRTPVNKAIGGEPGPRAVGTGSRSGAVAQTAMAVTSQAPANVSSSYSDTSPRCARSLWRNAYRVGSGLCEVPRKPRRTSYNAPPPRVVE